jgi:UDP-N-acetylmuramoyl-tripeptide--D-alanyl-D-alanine ligase
MNFRLEEIAEYVSGQLDRSGTTRVRGYSIDSRSIKQGELFLAVRGPNFDGHDFIAEASGRGASGAGVAREFSGEGADLPLIRVESTLDALQLLARAARRAWGGPIVAVTGSIGKTTTKEMVSAVLGERHTVLRSVGNMNNAYGLPLCLLRVEKYHDLAVLEMGMSAVGEIRNLASIAEPNEGVITNVNPVHLEFFKSISEIARAKAELLGGLTGERRAYLNNDDSRVRSMSRRFDGEIVTYGIRSVAAFRVTRIENLGLEGTGFTVRNGRRAVNFVLPMLGAHNVSNAVAAISVGVTRGIDWEDARLAVEKMAPEKMRCEVVRFREGFALIDDSYNSSPKALTEMTKLLGQFSGFRRKILVAGEMLELGETSRKLHAACGKEAVKAGIDLIVGVGGDARALLDGAVENGADPSRMRFVRDSVEAGDFLTETLRTGDLVLLKGSRGVHLEQALDTLRLSFSSLEP